jgi:hypothetical protein
MADSEWIRVVLVWNTYKLLIKNYSQKQLMNGAAKIPREVTDLNILDFFLRTICLNVPVSPML